MNRNIRFSIILLVLILALTGCINSTDTPVEVEEVQIGMLKGATSVGLAEMVQDVEGIADENSQTYNLNYNLVVQPEEVAAGLTKGEIQMAAIPGNLAATLYNKTEGQVVVLSTNTLGVHYIVSSDPTIKSIEDLNGKTIYSIGKGATPEAVLRNVLTKNEVDANIEFVNEAPEIAAAFKTKENVIAMVPEPFATVMIKTNEGVERVLDMNELWLEVNDNNPIVTGVFVARRDFVEKNEDFVIAFLDRYEQSINTAKTNPEAITKTVEEMEIIPEGLAESVIPFIDMEFISDSELKLMYGNYLQALYDFNPQIIGGELPDGDFYYAK